MKSWMKRLAKASRMLMLIAARRRFYQRSPSQYMRGKAMSPRNGVVTWKVSFRPPSARGSCLLTLQIGKLYPQMRPLCNLKADLSNLRDTVQPKSRADGASYWEMRFEIEIWYRGTKLQAKIKWEDEVNHFFIS